MNKQVYIFGWNGQLNAGDDAMTSAMVEEIAARFDDRVDFFIASHSGRLAHYTARNVNIRAFSLYGSLGKLPLIRRFAALMRIRSIFGKKIDLLIFGGGSIIQTVGNSKIKEEIVRVAKKHNPSLRVAAVGVSVGPFKNAESEEAAKSFMRTLDLVNVRDKRSYDYLQSVDISVDSRLLPDVALALPLLKKRPVISRNEPAEAEGLTIGICLRHGRSKNFYPSLGRLMHKIDELRPGTQFKFFSLSGHTAESDSSEAEAFLAWSSVRELDKVAGEVIGYSNSPSEYYNQFEECDAILCVRLHAAVFAYSVGVPFAALSYHTKCKDFANLVGLPDDLVLEHGATEQEADKCAIRLLQGGHTYLENNGAIKSEALGHFDFLNEI